MYQNPTRRTFLAAAGSASTVLLAGCSGNGNGDDEPSDDEPSDESPEDRARTFLDDQDAGGWDGDVADETGQDEIVIAVGAGPNGFQFGPAGVRVDAGTTVVWEWTGQGGGHNVSSEGASDFEFESERTDEEGFTFEQTFEEEGLAAYVCTPHRAQGMYGAVVVE